MARHCNGLPRLAFLFAFAFSFVRAFYLPGIVPVDYEEGASMDILAQKLTSNTNKVPYDYYSVPHCKPPSHAPNSRSARAGLNLGQVLVGERANPTSYEIHMLAPVTCKVLCVEQITPRDAINFQKRIEDKYRVRLTLDNMPVVMRMLGSSSYTLGYPLGYVDKDADVTYLNNHLRFIIKYHKPYFAFTDNIALSSSSFASATPTGAKSENIDAADSKPPAGTRSANVYRVVGFQVEPISVAHEYKNKKTPSKPSTCPVLESSQGQAIKDNISITFTYDVTFEESQLEWATRWDPLLTARPEYKQIQWFAVVNSVLLGVFLTALLAVIMLRTVHRDLARYAEVANSLGAAIEDPDLGDDAGGTLGAHDLSGWKLLRGDVFRQPSHLKLLCVMCGTGAQIIVSAGILLLVTIFGFISPGQRGMLLTLLLLLWVLASSMCGYVAGRLYKATGGDNWRQVAFAASFAFPSIIFGVFFFLNFFLWAMGSVSAVPFLTVILLLFLWLGVSVPLVFLGTLAGYRQKPYEFPVRTNQIPRKVPHQSTFMSHGIFLASGILPFGVVCIELVFILDSLWQNELYYAFGFLFLVFLLLVVTAAETSIVIVYIKLMNEDYRWWWQAFFASGSSGLYVLLFSLYYIVSHTELERGHVISDLLCFGYMSLISFMFFLMAGCAGFFGAFWFVVKIFSAVRVD